MLLSQLEIACASYQVDVIRQLMLDAPTGFNPTDDNCDLVWRRQQQSMLDQVKVG